MRIDRGVHVRGLRMRLTLQSEDTETHSTMSGNLEVLEALATELNTYALKRVAEIPLKIKDNA